MLRNLPFVGNFPVLLQFGDRPDLFGQVSQADIPLKGHPGVDFALPEGTPVVAVQHGVVLEVREEAQGYGRSVLLGHRWGQSFYAHLSEIRVQEGQQVGASQIVGLSGSGGPTAAPHLHFGLRLLPYFVGDGWSGFVDPMPYLERLSTAKGAIIGPHIMGDLRPHLDVLERWQPRLITLHDPDPDQVAALRGICPQSVIVARVAVAPHDLYERIRTDPVEAANWANEIVRARLVHGIDYWQVANEILQDMEDLPLLSKFELARMRLAERSGYRCAIIGFGVSNPDLPEGDRLAAWRRVYPSLERAEKRGHVVAVHQYGMPDLWGPNNAYDWYLLRLEHQVLPRLPFRKLKFAVTEFGIDGLIRGDQPAGWQTFTTPEGYVEQLLKCGRYLERFSGQILGYSVFTLGHTTPWATYDIAGKAATYLADLSDKGTWLQVDTQVFDIAPHETDAETDPGPEIGQVAQLEQPAGSAGAVDQPLPGAQPAAAAPPPTQPQDAPRADETTDEEAEEPHAQTLDTSPGDEQQPVEGVGPAPDEGRAPDDATLALEAAPLPEEPAPTTPEVEAPSGSPLVAQRIAPAFQQYNMTVKTIDERPDQPPMGDVVYLVKDIFMTYYGSWEPNGALDSVAAWAREAYLRPEFLEAGADHHLFAAIIGLDGEFVKGHEVSFWSDGFERLGDPAYGSYNRERTKEGSGWANIFMAGGSSFVPQSGESGPWCWAPAGAAEVVCGGGLPLNHPVSTFVVWQAVPRADWEAARTETPAIDTPTQPGRPTAPQPGGPSVDTRVSEWIALYNVSINPIAARPDRATGDVIYLVKDIFTTRNGSWEPISLPGSVPQWARDDYLKPLNAPDYFDEAGGDHHLFAAVIGLDGNLIRQQEILYWSDGFDVLGDANYKGYIRRRTRERSGWANIITGPGSIYVPARGENGPWCWAPTGAAEVVSGGGLPANHHISFFVVWQAVPNPDGQQKPSDGHEVFVPIVSQMAPLAKIANGTGAIDLSATGLLALRQALWTRIGIEYRSDSALAGYARRIGLGMPITQEFEVSGLRAQGFQGGIVYCPTGDPSRVGHISW
jgi:hypothetical protein